MDASIVNAPEGYRASRVWIDITQDTPSIPAFVHASETWNGWAIPLFTREALIANADALRAIFQDDEMPEGERMLLTFDADGFPSIIDEQYPEGGDVVVAVEIDGQTFYDIGGRGFTWMEDERDDDDAEAGAYGIRAVDPSTPGAIICGICGRAWLEDITPAGRCPWEHVHDDDDDN